MPDDGSRTSYGMADDRDAPDWVKQYQQRPPAPSQSGAVLSSDGSLSITINDDGSVDFSKPAVKSSKPRASKFDENLADVLPDTVLAVIAEDYLDGVAQDILSRSEFIANYNRGIDLLGLKIEEASNRRGPRGTISRVKHPVLLEACVKYQSAASAELLPAAGPAKIKINGEADSALDQLARDFEQDFNYYLTDIAKEYYPDTRRSLFYQAFGGTMYKKVFHCPIRRRPVSESVNLTDLIVSETATDLDNAIRKTHEIIMTPNQVKRMQIFGHWKDVHLGQPMAPQNQARMKILQSQGISPMTSRPNDMCFTIYEGYAELDLGDYGFPEPGVPDGLPVPYRITLDRDSRQVLEIRRNWKKGDPLYRERRRFIKFGLIPGLGFLDYGYLHLVGNQARALTAIWQLLIDKGLLSNFPGGIKTKGVRISTNEVAPGLGEFMDIDIGDMDDIRKAVMGMPYGEISSVFIQLAEIIGQDAQRLAGAVDLEVGEGRANVPVGTIMAMIEQQTQVMGAIHKANHKAQSDELMLLRELISEDPMVLSRLARNPARQWESAEEFMNLDLSPASDPNVPAQMHRIMQMTLIEQMAQGDPLNFDRKEVHRESLRAIGKSADGLLLPGPSASPQPPPQQQQQQGPPAGMASAIKTQMEMPLKQAQNQLGFAKLKQDMVENQREAAAQEQEAEQREKDRQLEAAVKQEELRIEEQRVANDHHQALAGLAMQHVHHQQSLAGGMGAGLPQ